MAAQPREEDVLQMCAMMNIGRPEALRRLKGNNNNLNQAIDEMFENPESSRYNWDEAQFSSERDGTTNNAGISFQIQGADETEPRYFPGAPSRPPSRTDNRSPIGDRVISLAAEHAAADPRSRMSRQEMDDTELQKALAQSAEEAGLPPQQYGVTEGVNTVHFGPANRSSYEGEWQMVHIGNSPALDLPLDVQAVDRKREDGVPAFLKPSTQDNRLASLLTILHEIPLAREIFLDREDLLPDFGHDGEWWTGKAIGAAITVSGRPWADNYAPDDDEVIREVQRLMAFLDKTDRSYGSAEVLANLKVVKAAKADEVESKFLEAWKDAHDGKPVINSLFSVAMQPKHVSEDTDLEGDSIDFAILDLSLPNTDDSGEVETLYDLADQVLWSSSGLAIENSAYLTRVGDTVAFRVQGQDSSKPVRIPSVWYADRYLETGREAALSMRKQKGVIRERMANIFAVEKRLTYFTLASGKVVKVQDMINTSLMHDAEIISDEMVNGISPEHEDADMASQSRASDKMDISAELQKVMASIDKKMRALELEKEKARTSLHELSKLLTTPSNDPSQSPSHKYTLRGVSTTKSVTYVRRQAEPDLIDMDLDATEPKNDGDQWWKIDFNATSAKPVSVQKVTEESVLNAAMTESKTTLVVYASKKAMAEPFQPLPDALEAFVRADNLAFSAEFPFIQESQSQTSVTTPKSPSKRKYADSSEDAQEAESRLQETSQIRWGGMSPVRDPTVLISQRELHNSDPAEAAKLYFPPPPLFELAAEPVPGRGAEDVIMGQDPAELVDTSVDVGKKVENGGGAPQEMMAKNGMPSLMPSLMGDGHKISAGPNDDMEVDELATTMTAADKKDVGAADVGGE